MPKCRYCGEPEAYDSGFTVECCNINCDHYCEEQRLKRAYSTVEKLQRQALLEEYLNETSDPDKTPTYHWGLDSPLIDKGDDRWPKLNTSCWTSTIRGL